MTEVRDIEKPAALVVLGLALSRFEVFVFFSHAAHSPPAMV
jgi:hypothetical protein